MNKLDLGNNFIAVANRRYKRKGRTRNHKVICFKCFLKEKVYRFKNINYHYKKYHPEVLEKFREMLSSGQIGVINGMRVYTT